MSLTGGTASGFFIDAGYLIRKYAETAGYDVKIVALLGIPNSAYKSTDRKASAYAALMELNHYYHDGTQYAQKFHHNRIPKIEGLSGDRPFSEVFLGMPRLGEHGEHPEKKLNDSYGEFIYLGAMSRISDKLAGQLINPSTQHAPMAAFDGSPQQFGAIGVSVIEYPAAHLMKGCTTKLSLEALSAWTNSDLKKEMTSSIIVASCTSPTRI